MRPSRFVFLITSLLAPIELRSEAPAQPIPITSDDKCLPVDVQWTPQEKLVWERVCTGKTADFRDEPGYGVRFDPRAPRPSNEVLESRTLRSSFIETILLKGKYRDALTRHGVQIAGARFAEPLNLEDADTGHVLAFWACLFEKGAKLNRLRSTQDITFTGSKVSGTLEMDSIQLGGSLSMREVTLDTVNLWSGHVGGTFLLGSSIVTGLVNMGRLRVDASLFARGAEFADIILESARISGDLDLKGAKVNGTLNMDGAHIGANLVLKDGIITGSLLGRNLEVDRNAYLSLRTFEGPIDFSLARIKGNMDLTRGNFKQNVDLTRGQIDGELHLGFGQSAAKWSTDKALILRNAKTDMIPSLADAWPPKLELDGFTYRGAGAVQGVEEWLSRTRYSAQPYGQLASVLQNQGNNETASEVRYAGKDRERRESDSLSFQRIWLTILWGSIGYGYYLGRALIPVVLFIISGTICLRLSKQSWGKGLHSWPDKIVYSFDMLLPIITLREKHRQIDLKGWPAYYFYLHKIMGYVLASFLIAGIAGLTK
jgi:hypothetical protein